MVHVCCYSANHCHLVNGYPHHHEHELQITNDFFDKICLHALLHDLDHEGLLEPSRYSFQKGFVGSAARSRCFKEGISFLSSHLQKSLLF